MKLLSILVFCSLLVASCKKDIDFTAAYAGTWEVEKSMSMSGVIYHLPGNGNIIFLGKDGSFERRSADTVSFRGLFYVESKKDCDGEKKYNIFKTSESEGEYRIIKESGKLILSTSGCYADGITAWYRLIE